MELSGKIISIVCVENADSVASSLSEGIADGFAYALEQDYASGEGSVGVYRLIPDSGVAYASKDSLKNLVIETGSDVVFVLDTLSVGKMTFSETVGVASASSVDSSFITVCKVPVAVRLYGFDAMNHEEKVYSFSGETSAVTDVYSDGKQSDSLLESLAFSSLEAAGWDVGRIMSAAFVSQWKHEQYSITCFDTEKWYKALNYANQYDWKEAMDIWLGLLDTNDMLKRSCAAYNISVACYMLGDYDLAGLWLDRSDTDSKLPQSDTMRKRINSRK